ncbi:Hypothetical predicted protein [Octopus vulgaris]|uniref:Uncharacterized protein n=1 Tax=Octopus vulgaris TaxID=6645 RepID=A0AA36AX23_OCTVU|nr:Hypothetical predicted protein [Octopus vulgaris]
MLCHQLQSAELHDKYLCFLTTDVIDAHCLTHTFPIAMQFMTEGFSSFGYLPTPTPTPSERLPHASPAFYAATEIFGAAPASHVAGHVTSAIQRTEPSQLSINSSPLPRDFTHRTTVLNSFAPPASFPSATSPANGRAFPAANSPGPIELYNSGQERSTDHSKLPQWIPLIPSNGQLLKSNRHSLKAGFNISLVKTSTTKWS